MYTTRTELAMDGVIALIDRDPSATESGPGAWDRIRERATTTPGRLIVVGLLVVVGALVFGVITSSAERSRERAAQAVRTATEPLLVEAATLYTSLSDANATVTTTFLKGGLEPPARHAHYLQDLRQASAAVATLTRDVGSSAPTRTAIRTITEALPVYSGLVETARADNRQGFPVGAAYLRQAATLLTTTILPAANRLYATEAQRLSDGYRRATSVLTLVLLAAAAGLALILLIVMQRYLASLSRRILNIPALLGTLVVAAVAIWAVAGFTGEENALATARRHSDRVEVLSGASVLLSRAQSDQSLTLVNRGSDETDPADFAAVMRTLSPATGLLGLVTGDGSAVAIHRLVAGFDRYQANTAQIRTLERQGLILNAIDRASSADSTATADGLQADLMAQVKTAQDRFTTAAADATGSLSGLWPALPVLTVLATALTLAGLLQRAGEYR